MGEGPDGADSPRQRERRGRRRAATDLSDQQLAAEGATCFGYCRSRWNQGRFDLRADVRRAVRSFKVGPNKATHLLELRYGSMKCLHHYFYLLDRHLGLMHLRLQTWAPFTVHVCINGREWLARQLAAKRIPFQQRDNCFVDVGCSRRAQTLLDSQLRTDWAGLLDGLLRKVHPTHATLFGDRPLDYYWSADETEWATDVLFRCARRWPTSIPGCCDTP